jgi:RNA polymerase sigma-70 factor (ECF subfamily)
MMALQRERLTDTQLQQEVLLVEAAKKDSSRFGAIYEKYYRQIFLFVFKRTSDEEICGDIVSQVFLKAMLSIQKFEYRGVPFSAWLYRIASNEVNQHFRTQKGDRTVSIDQPNIDRVMGMVEEVKGEDNTGHYTKVMLETLTELDPEDVQIIELRFFEDLPFKDVAFIIGITENNAKVRVYRILERLRKRLLNKIGGKYEA